MNVCNYDFLYMCTIAYDVLEYSYVTYVEVPPYLSRRQAAYVIGVEGRAHAVTGLSQCILSQVCICIIDIYKYMDMYFLNLFS